MKKRIAILMACMLMFSAFSGFAASFNDVTEAHDWARAEIESYAERGILAGDGKGSFFPDNSVTRAEFAKMLCLVFDMAGASEVGYTDVDKDSWQYAYVAKTNAYVYTDNGEIYAPDAAATRAELAYAIVNAAGFAAQEVELPFTDADEIIPELEENAKTAYALELLKGYPDNTFRPNAAVTRAEAVVLLARAEAALAQMPPAEQPETETTEPTDPPAPESPSAGEIEKEPTQNAVKIHPMETLCYIESVTQALDPEEDETRLRLKFYVSGSEQLQMLYMDTDVPIYDVDGTQTALKTGDVICVNTNLYGEVKLVRIITRMNGANLPMPMSSETVFLNKLYAPAAEKWGYLEEGKKHEVYLGFFGEMEYEEEEAKIFIYPSNGKKNADGVRVIAVPADTPVITYTTNAKKKNPFGFETMETVEYYGATKDEYGNILWESRADEEFYQYVFVKTKDDVITDLVIISNR